MTPETRNLTALASLPCDYFTAADIAPIMRTGQQTLRCLARNHPDRLPFPSVCIGNRVLFPKIPFLEFWGYKFKGEIQQ